MAIETTRIDTENHIAEEKKSVDHVIKLMQKWANDKSDYDAKTWPVLKKSLEQDRLSERKLFNG